MSDTQRELEELRALVATLTQRVYRLEQAAGVSARPPAATTAPVPDRVAPAQPPQTPISAGLEAALPERADAPSLETRIGSHWLNRVGIAAVFVGASYFLKLAFESGWIGPAGRVIIGLLAGAAMVVWSERFRSRGYVLFSYSLKAVGIGILYLSLWASFQVYHLMPVGAAFLGMLLVTAGTAVLALQQQAQLLAALALLGGFATPLLLSTGQNRPLEFFSYVLVLDVAALVWVARRGWDRLLLLSFAGTLSLYLLWRVDHYEPSQLAWSLTFATLFFVVFAVAPLLARTRLVTSTEILLLVCLFNAAAYFLEIYDLLEPRHQEFLPWIALLVAAGYLLLSTRLKPGGDALAGRLLYSLHIALAIGFITIAVPLRLQTHWITIGWLVESAALLWVARRESSDFLRTLAVCALALGIGRLLLVDNFSTGRLLLNARLATFGVAIAVLAFVAATHRRLEARDEISRPMAQLAVILINILALVALNGEVRDFFARRRPLIGDNIARDFTYSAVWMTYGAALMAVGFRRRSSFLRWQALVLVALTTIKVFTYDVSQLEQGYRILSFIALGIVLLVISFAYQRNWLRLSGEDSHDGQV